MENFAFWSSNNSLLKLQVLFRPMLFLSIALHGLLLSLPLPSDPEPQAKSDPKNQETVKITRLLPPSPSTPQVAQSTAEPSLTQEKPRLQPTKTTRPTAQKPVTNPNIQPSPLKPQKPLPPSPVAQQPNKTQAPTQKKPSTPKPTPIPTPNVNAEMSAKAGTSLIGELRPRVLNRLSESGTNDPKAMQAYIDSLPIDFVQNDQKPFFFRGTNQLKEGAIGSLSLPQMSPTGAYNDYIEPVIKNELGFKLTQLNDYGKSALYKAQNQEGVVFYMSLVKLKGSGALLVLWQDDPNS